jgi:methionyl-tRNA formyltransferase
MINNNQNQPFSFFGSSNMSVFVLDELLKLGLKPEFIVTTPDKPVGRKQIITPNVVKTWALENKIPVYDPEKLNSDFGSINGSINNDWKEWMVNVTDNPNETLQFLQNYIKPSDFP